MRIKFLAIVLMVNCTVLSFAQGIEFFHGTWEEVKAKAKEADKLVFVDAYTTWCGPCKRMAANIFPLPEVGEFYNANFINYKLDMEKGEGPDFARKYGVRAIPPLYSSMVTEIWCLTGLADLMLRGLSKWERPLLISSTKVPPWLRNTKGAIAALHSYWIILRHSTLQASRA